MPTVATERLFVAIPLPPPVREQLADLYEPVRGVVWTRSEQLHLTLRFLGDVECSLLEPIEAALGRVRVEPFVLPVGGTGSFPPTGPARVLWAGVGRGHTRLHQLRQQVDDALLSTGLPFDVKTFHPHVTLGRVKSGVAPGAIAEFLKRRRKFEAAPFRAEAIHLYASELRPSGAMHILRRSFPLQNA